MIRFTDNVKKETFNRVHLKEKSFEFALPNEKYESGLVKDKIVDIIAKGYNKYSTEKQGNLTITKLVNEKENKEIVFKTKEMNQFISNIFIFNNIKQGLNRKEDIKYLTLKEVSFLKGGVNSERTKDRTSFLSTMFISSNNIEDTGALQLVYTLSIDNLIDIEERFISSIKETKFEINLIKGKSYTDFIKSKALQITIDVVLSNRSKSKNIYEELFSVKDIKMIGKSLEDFISRIHLSTDPLIEFAEEKNFSNIKLFRTEAITRWTNYN